MRNYIKLWQGFVDASGGKGFIKAIFFAGTEGECDDLMQQYAAGANVDIFGEPVLDGPTFFYLKMNKAVIITLLREASQTGTFDEQLLVASSPRGSN